jgi:hypothetical protein
VLGLDTQVNQEVSLGLITCFNPRSADSIRQAVGRLSRIAPENPIRQQLIERYSPARVVQSYLNVIRELV